jgi:hypothetical protein
LKNLDSHKPKYVKEVLKNLPPTLDDTYTRMLTRIKELYHSEALTLLCWLAYARSPLTLGQLVDAAITNPLEESFIDTSERGDLDDALKILSGLVTVEENQVADAKNYSRSGDDANDASTADSSRGGTMFHTQHLTKNTRARLAHFSVKEYLESERILGTKANQFHLESAVGHQIVAQSCLTYLRYYTASKEKTSTEQDLEIFPMLKYAAESWFYHSSLQHCIGGSREASLLQFEDARNDWLLVHDPEDFWSTPFVRSERMSPCSAIYYASFLGLLVVVKSLIGGGSDVNAQGGQYDNALQAASAGGYTEIVQLLLDNGAKVNAQGGEYGNALQAASIQGHTEIVQLLLDKGAEVNAQGGECGNALYAASIEGHTEIVRLLLDKGAEVNAQGGEYGNAPKLPHTEATQRKCSCCDRLVL